MPDTGKSTTKSTAQTPRKRMSMLPFLAVTAVALCAVVVFLTRGHDVPNVTASNSAGTVTIGPGESLVIPTAEISDKASFYPVTVDGTLMEVIAVRDSAGTVRTAFNTCQICYDSGKGYYVQSGSYLVCQNCGNRFSMDQVGIAAGGCNPWPIFTKNTTLTADTVSISYNFLAEAREIFAQWKVSGLSPWVEVQRLAAAGTGGSARRIGTARRAEAEPCAHKG